MDNTSIANDLWCGVQYKIVKKQNTFPWKYSRYFFNKKHDTFLNKIGEISVLLSYDKISGIDAKKMIDILVKNTM